MTSFIQTLGRSDDSQFSRSNQTTHSLLSKFADSMLHYMKKPNAKPNDWMRALCRIMMYREDALAQVSTQNCQQIASQCFKQIKNQIYIEGEAKYIYRHGSLCIAYLLRRRRYDDSYMDPSSNFACQVKMFMEDTIKGMNDGSIINIEGFIDLAGVTKTIIDYIDRRGKGHLTLD